MSKVAKGIKGILYVFVLFCLLWICGESSLSAADGSSIFMGEGTKSKPYLIQTVDDLILFRDLVNQGNDFKDIYFLQTQNLNLRNKSWTPIGIYESNHYFLGVYNGGGHFVENLVVLEKAGQVNNSGFFGALGGTVLNFGIESGEIHGNCVGSIASHSVNNYSPKIINCYSKANLYGQRVGGIADNFGENLIVNCWYDLSKGSLNGEQVGTICSYSASVIDSCNFEAGEVGSNDITASFREYLLHWIQWQEINESWLSKVGYADYDIVQPWMWDGKNILFGVPYGNLSNNIIQFNGEGSKENPYVISSKNDLLNLRRLVNGGGNTEGMYFKQNDNIDLTGVDWIPIGCYEAEDGFRGIYDGGGHSIYNLECIQNDLMYGGLFGKLGGVVANLRLINANICAPYAAGIAASAVDESNPAIFNCFVTGRVSGNKPGGIISSLNEGVVSCCVSDVEINVNEKKNDIGGGIVASVSNTKVYGCFSVDNRVMPEAYRSATSQTIDRGYFYESSFALRLNVLTALSQCLFANRYNVDVMQWQEAYDSGVLFEDSRRILSVVSSINEYGFIILLVSFIAFVLVCYTNGSSEKRRMLCNASMIICSLWALFWNCAVLGNQNVRNNCTGVLLCVLLNIFFMLLLVVNRMEILKEITKIRKHWELVIVICLIIFLECLQFSIVPRYDSSIYYGSLANACKIFSGDLFTYLGGFVCWKWIHGAALFLCPFEFILPGKMIGMYIGTCFISVFSVIAVYSIIQAWFPEFSRKSVAVLSSIIVLFPYQLGMFTYLSFDNLCVYFATWLVCAYIKRNDLLISFCGFLLCFTKISGAAFYVTFLMIVAAFEILVDYRGKIFSRFFRWLKLGRCLLWVAPVALYLGSMVVGEYITIQHFAGANLVTPVAVKPVVSYLNTFAQFFIWGFRWLWWLSILFIIVWKNRKRLGLIWERKNYITVAIFGASMAVLGLLLLYNSDAECPRYTALANVFLCIITPAIVSSLSASKNKQGVISFCVATLLIMQTYYTIDPSIFLFRSGIDTGKKMLYKIALDGDDRPGMNLGADRDVYYQSVGDIYAYNFEYNYYNDLIYRMMDYIEPQLDDKFYILDVIDYELHLAGNQYKILWDSSKKKFTYNEDQSDAYRIWQRTLGTSEIEEGMDIYEKFYLIVPYRVNASRAKAALSQRGYELVDERVVDNFYGQMTILYYES